MAAIPVSPRQAYALQRSGVALIDVREPAEWADGMAEGAKPIAKTELEKSTCFHIADIHQPVILICAGGKRSDACAEALTALGYERVYSVQGGTRAWQAQGLPMVVPESPDFDRRYARQMILPSIGRTGQEKLAKARVLLVGAGGLGSPCAFYLAAAGVGFLRIVDNDTVDLSNLQRQILHKNGNVGEKKVISAKETLLSLNPTISVESVIDTICPDNIRNYIKDVDLVIDGTDNFSSRYSISDACTEQGKPWVYGAVYRFEGQVSLFHAKPGDGPCYRCLFPDAADAGAPNCTEAGVLGVTPGVIGLLQASEALKYLLGIGEPLVGRLLGFDLLAMRSHETRFSADPACPVCGGA